MRDQGNVVEFVLTSRRARAKHLRIYIHEDDLPIVMALPAGPNAVSKALDAMSQKGDRSGKRG